jgi:hypothetical protein
MTLVRKGIAVAVLSALPVGAVSGPLVHAHLEHHATEHHEGPVVHTHWTGHQQPHYESDGLALEADNHDDAVFLNAFIAVATPSLPALGPVQGVFELPVPAEAEAHRSVAIVHGHDPPLFSPLSSRAPPAFLS